MKRKCPKCNLNKVIPILYGYLSGDMLKKAEMGEIKLGGCIVTPENPKWYCKDCGNEWK